MVALALTDGDVLLVQTDDGGELLKRAGFVEMTSGFETMAYLCLFGGNETDAGGTDLTYMWWGNYDEPDPEKWLRSETQFVIHGLPRTFENLRKIEDAARRDLNIFIKQKIASEVKVQAEPFGRSAVKLLIDINAFGVEYKFNFVENWRNAE